MPLDVYLNVAVGGVLTGLVYGLMALGLSVIFGVVRVVNFAHGEMMSIAMFLAVVLFSAFHLDPLIMLVPIAAVMFVFGYAAAGRTDQSLHHPAGAQPVPAAGGAGDHHRQRAVDHLRSGRPHRADGLRLRQFPARSAARRRPKLYAGAAAIVFAALLFAFFRFTLIGKAIRACADNYTGALVVGLNVNRLYALTFGIGAACVGAAGVMMTLIVDVTPMIGPTYTLLAFVIVITGGLGSMPGALRRRRPDRADRGAGRIAVHAVRQEHVRLRHPGAGAAVPAARHPRQEGDVMAAGSPPSSRVDRRHVAPDDAPARRAARGARRRAVDRQRLSRHRPHSHSLSRLYRPGLEHHDGLRRPAFARPCHLCRAGRLCRGGAVHALRRRPVARLSRRHAGRRGLRGDHRLSRLPLRRHRRLFRHPHHRLCRVRPHRLRSSRLRQRLRRLVPAGRAICAQRSVAAARQIRRCSIT